MATYITEDGNVFYENQPEAQRALWKNEPNTSAINELITKAENTHEVTGTKTTAITDGKCTGFKDETSGSVRISFYATNSSSTIPVDTAFFELPDDCKPSDRYGIPCMFVLSNGTVAPYYALVGTDGKITHGFSSSVKSILGCGEYPV